MFAVVRFRDVEKNKRYGYWYTWTGEPRLRRERRPREVGLMVNRFTDNLSSILYLHAGYRYIVSLELCSLSRVLGTGSWLRKSVMVSYGYPRT